MYNYEFEINKVEGKFKFIYINIKKKRKLKNFFTPINNLKTLIYFLHLFHNNFIHN